MQNTNPIFFISISKIKLIGFVFALLLNQIAISQDNSTSTTDLDIPNFHKVYALPSLNHERVEIYKNSKSSQYFYNPLILVDWNDFKSQLDKYNASDKDLKVDVIIKIRHLSDKVEDEIKSFLIRESIGNLNLSILPHTHYIIEAKIGSERRILNQDDIPTIASGIKLQTTHLIDKERSYPINASLKNLKTFYDQRSVKSNIQGFLYSHGFKYSNDYIKGMANFAKSTEINRKLFGDEQFMQNQIARSTSSDNGMSLNLGPFKLGGGKVDSVIWTESIKKRIVNRNYLSDLIEKNSAEITVSSIGNADSLRETKNQIVKLLLDKVFTQVNLEFVKISDKEYNLVENNITYATLKDKQVDNLLSSKPKRKFSGQNEQSGSYNGASVSNKENINSESSDEITWQYKGNDWIPTKVNMYIVSETMLNNSFSIETISINKEGDKIIASPFIYPATWLAENPQLVQTNIVDRDNPIGTILAFAGNVDKIPVGWKQCNGEKIPILGNEELFNVIGYIWGQKESNGDFTLPDLRGVFLRGVDSNRNYDLDRARKKEGVGSFQEDTFKEHNHGMRHWHGSGSIEGFEMTINKAHPIEKSTMEGGTETRPKNYAVIYIIRCK